MTSTDEPYDVNVRQAAEILGVHENTVRAWAKGGRLPSRQLPGSGFHRFRRSVLEAIRREMDQGPSYHDLHITTDKIPRTSIFDLPYGIEVTCNRVAGWQVRDHNQMVPPPPGFPNLSPDPRLLGGEYDAEPEECEEGRPIIGGLRLDVAGFVIVDSLSAKPGQGGDDVADLESSSGEALPDDELEAIAQAAVVAVRAGGRAGEVAEAMLPELRLLAARVRAEAAAGECEREDCQQIAHTAFAEQPGNETACFCHPGQFLAHRRGSEGCSWTADPAAGSVPVATPHQPADIAAALALAEARAEVTEARASLGRVLAARAQQDRERESREDGPVATPTGPECRHPLEHRTWPGGRVERCGDCGVDIPMDDQPVPDVADEDGMG